MLPERFFLGQPVRSLQHMLREISYIYTDLPRLVPDGIFEEKTAHAVRMFQQQSNLPVTGEVDNITWDAIVLVYQTAILRTQPPRRLEAYPAPAYRVNPGQSTIHMLIIQSMFKSLSYIFAGVKDVKVNGVHTGLSVKNALWLQNKAGLEKSGVVDNLTWNMLTRLYEIFITRNSTLQ